MTRTARSLWFPLALAACLVPAGTRADVKDDGAFFKNDAVRKAEDEIKQIKQLYKKTVVVETYKAVPANKAKDVEKMSAADREKFFEGWAADRLKAAKADVLFFACKQPGHLQILVNFDTMKDVFGVKDREKIVGQTLEHFRKGEFDRGLTEAVHFVGERLRAAAPAPAALPKPVANEVKDHGDFFKTETENKATAELREINKTFKKTVVIETFKGPAADRAEQVKAMRPADRDRFFREWLDDRMKQSHADVHILISREPGRVEVGVGDQALKKAFPKEDRDKLRDLLVASFGKKEFDNGLTEATHFLSGRLAANLATPLPAPVVGAVTDHAGFFRPAAVQSANGRLKEIKQTFRRDVVVETFKGVPPDRAEQVKAMKPADRDRFFDEWLADRMRQSKADVHALICQDPTHLAIGSGGDADKKAFPKADRDKLRDLLVARFAKKDFDNGLAEGVGLIRSSLESNLAPSLPSAVAGEVKDHAGIFADAAAAGGSAEARQIKQRLGLDVAFETFARVAPDKLSAVKAMNESDRNRFFNAWLGERMGQSKADVHVLVCMDPPHVEVGTSPRASAKAFPADDRDRLARLLVGRFRDKKYNEGLREGLDLVYDTVDGHVSPAPPEPVLNAVKDHAGLFADAAERRAAEEFDAVRRARGIDVTVETFLTPRPGQAKKVTAMTVPDRESHFAAWAAERAARAKAGGVFVLVCKEPGHVHVFAGDEARKAGFSAPDRKGLGDLLASRLAGRGGDAALLDGAAYLADSLAAARVRDGAGWFSPAARDRADALVRETRRRHKKDVIVETYAAVPADRAKGVNLGDGEARGKFFVEWARDRLKARGGDGVLVLICKEPEYLQVEAGAETGKTAFVQADADKVRERLVARMAEKKYDDALDEALRSIDASLRANLAPPPVGEKPTPAKADPTTPAPSGPPDSVGKVKEPEPAPPAAPEQKGRGWVFWAVVVVAVLGAGIVLLVVLSRGRRGVS